jgi:hypothetical protein
VKLQANASGGIYFRIACKLIERFSIGGQLKSHYPRDNPYFNFMKLDFIHDITDKGKYPDADPDKLIRIYSFDQEEVEKLINIIHSRVVNMKESIDLGTLPFIRPINCSLKFEVAATDIGINPSLENSFVCQLSTEAYTQMIGYMRTFCGEENKMNGYNWLYDPSEGKIDLLFSPGGTW